MCKSPAKYMAIQCQESNGDWTISLLHRQPRYTILVIIILVPLSPLLLKLIHLLNSILLNWIQWWVYETMAKHWSSEVNGIKVVVTTITIILINNNNSQLTVFILSQHCIIIIITSTIETIRSSALPLINLAQSSVDLSTCNKVSVVLFVFFFLFNETKYFWTIIDNKVTINQFDHKSL